MLDPRPLQSQTSHLQNGNPQGRKSVLWHATAAALLERSPSWLSSPHDVLVQGLYFLYRTHGAFPESPPVCPSWGPDSSPSSLNQLSVIPEGLLVPKLLLSHLFEMFQPDEDRPDCNYKGNDDKGFDLVPIPGMAYQQGRHFRLMRQYSRGFLVAASG